MRKSSIICFIIQSILLYSSCSSQSAKREKLTPEQIESKYSSGVVLIKNTYYFTISFNGSEVLYFTGLDSNGNPENLTLNQNELTPVTTFGTGFFLSKDGMIATNSHVAVPTVDTGSTRSSIMNYFIGMTNEWTKEINEINEKLGILKLAIISSESIADKRQYQQMYDELVQGRDSSQEAVNMIHSLGSMDYKITVHTNIGVVYNDTHLTNINDFNECVTIADDSLHDLSIIQLKDKKTPAGRHIFKISKIKKTNNDSQTNNIKVGKKLYMIGFNLGPTLAMTNQGIKAQITSGEISQNSDDTSIMYTIPALHGSSGSPVIDEYGKLIAINHAGIDETQSFNYGIKANHLRNMLTKLNDE